MKNLLPGQVADCSLILFSILESPFRSSIHVTSLPLPSVQVDGKVVDGVLGDANGVEPPRARVKSSGKWQKPRFSRKALMRCCLVRWIIASTQPQDKGERLTVSQLCGLLCFLCTGLTC